MSNPDGPEASGKKQEVGVIDIEEYANAGRKVPEKARYRVRIDNQHYEVEQRHITGRELLVLASKNPPERYALRQRIRGQVIRVGLDDIVDLAMPGLERFMTLPLDQTEGSR